MMGMFDSFIDESGNEWQTKAFECDLMRWRIGDNFPQDDPGSFQVEIYDYRGSEWFDSLATIRDGVVIGIDVPRDPSLPLISSWGYVTERGDHQ